VLDYPTGVRVLVADGLGHGVFAADASREAVATFRAHPHRPLPEVLELIHLALKKTRGAAAAIAEIHLASQTVTMAGVGNISVRIFNAEGKSRQMASGNGTLGAAANRINQFTADWHPENLLVLHSDGVSADWNPGVYPGLLQRHPAVIAGVIYRDFGRPRDDSTIVVASCPQ
jgi:serine phosphatase RsbU (regulator of sigma subunit)